MTCEPDFLNLFGVHICAPSTVAFRLIRECPTCQQRRRFSGLFAEWYGTTWTCCACGDSWTDGERHDRPFKPGWRKKAAAEAKKHWAEAGTKAEQRARFEALLEKP